MKGVGAVQFQDGPHRKLRFDKLGFPQSTVTTKHHETSTSKRVYSKLSPEVQPFQRHAKRPKRGLDKPFCSQPFLLFLLGPSSGLQPERVGYVLSGIGDALLILTDGIIKAKIPASQVVVYSFWPDLELYMRQKRSRQPNGSLLPHRQVIICSMDGIHTVSTINPRFERVDFHSTVLDPPLELQRLQISVMSLNMKMQLAFSFFPGLRTNFSFHCIINRSSCDKLCLEELLHFFAPSQHAGVLCCCPGCSDDIWTDIGLTTQRQGVVRWVQREQE